MHDWVSFNSQIIRASDAKLSAVSNAAMYGKGVFTTIAIRDGLPILFDKHWRRIEDNAARLEIGLFGLRKEQLFASLIELIDKNAVKNGRCRVTLFDGSLSGIWQNTVVPGSPVLIQTGDARALKTSLSLGISAFPVNSKSPLNNIKSCNYLERIHAFEAASASGFDEAVRVNELGEIVSACLANLFWKTDGRIYTSSSDTGCLDGTTRNYVLERCSVSSIRTGIEALKRAQSVFLTSAGIGIATVGECVFESESVKYEPLADAFFDENGLERVRY